MKPMKLKLFLSDFSFIHREARLDPSLLSIGIVCDVRVAHGRQFTGGVFAGVSMIV